MSRAALNELIIELPYSLRERIDGYVASVVAESEAIFEEAGVPLTRDLLGGLIFFAGVRKLWAIVDSYYALMVNSLALVESHDIEVMMVGATRYSRHSETYTTIRQLRNQLESQLLELGIYSVLQERSLASLVRELADER